MSPRPPTAEPFRLGGETVPPGTTRRVELQVARLPPETTLQLPVMVVHGARPGPRLWVSAAIHGDEMNGIEIVRRVLERLDPARLHGTLLGIPIVNVYGFVHQSRYLPDRRDLNRCFPGSRNGSLAARLAHLFMHEIVQHCDHGIDLHTGSDARTNLPQVRADLSDAATRRLAVAFAAPVMVHSRTRDGSLRDAAARRGVPMLLFEGGEAGRFDEAAIRVGTRGVLQVMQELGMRTPRRAEAATGQSVEVHQSRWIRADRSGILRLEVQPGDRVAAGQRLGRVADPFGADAAELLAPAPGLVLGLTTNPVVYMGDAVVHLAPLAPA